MFAFVRYELVTPLPAEEVYERIARHTIHWQFGRFPKSYEGVPRAELYFIGRVSPDSFSLQVNEDSSEDSSHAVARGRISAGPEGTRISVRSRPPVLTWLVGVIFALFGLPCLALAAAYPFHVGFDWTWSSILATGLIFSGIVPWAVLKGRYETRLFRKQLTKLLRPERRARHPDPGTSVAPL